MVAKKAQQQQKTGCTHWHTRTLAHTNTHQQANQSQRIIDMVAAASVGGQFAAAAATAATTTGSIVSCQMREREQGGRLEG